MAEKQRNDDLDLDDLGNLINNMKIGFMDPNQDITQNKITTDNIINSDILKSHVIQEKPQEQKPTNQTTKFD